MMRKAATKKADTAPSVDEKATSKPAKAKASAKAMTMNFGEAIAKAKLGAKIARTGWNGKGMFVIYVPGTPRAEMKPGTPYANALGRRKFATIEGHFDMFTTQKSFQPGWLASQGDMQATDWIEVK